MKRKLLIPLLVCAVTTPAVTAAQGPFPLAVVREAGHAAEPSTVSGAALKRAGADWSRVRKLAPGTEVFVTMCGARPGLRLMLEVDDEDLTLLDVGSSRLSSAAVELLRRLAAQDGAYLIAPTTGKEFEQADVQIREAGIFAHGVQVMSLPEIIARIPRTDVAEISVARTRSAKGRGALIGAGAGLAIAALSYAGSTGADRGWSFMMTAPWFAGLGTGVGFAVGTAVDFSGQVVIYRVPSKCRSFDEHYERPGF